MKRTRVVLLLLVLVAGVTGSALTSSSQRGAAPAGGVLASAVSAANALVASLTPEQREKVVFPFDSPQKTNWSNLPNGIFVRHSLRIGELTPPQRDAVFALLKIVLSADGYTKAINIMNGDQVLQERGGGRTGGRPGAPAGGGGGARGPRGGGGGGGRGGGVIFGKDEYYIALLGAPSMTAPWMVQFGGHHLGLNVTIVGPHSVLTPSLPAAQPATYTLNGETIRPLGKENDKGFALINALTAAQRQQAILPYEVRDLVLGPLEDGKVIQPEGILASALTASQQAMLLDVAHEWVGILNNQAAAERMAEIRANLAKTYFAWSGPITNGSLAYYRIQGPTLVIEYAPQQGDLDHIHTIYRDPTNDYGAGLVGR